MHRVGWVPLPLRYGSRLRHASCTTRCYQYSQRLCAGIFKRCHSTRCQGCRYFHLTWLRLPNSTSIVYSLDAASMTAGNSINAANGTITFVQLEWSSTTITATANGCNGPASSTHVITITPNGTPSFALGANSSTTQGSGTITYTATANNGTAVTYAWMRPVFSR